MVHQRQCQRVGCHTLVRNIKDRFCSTVCKREFEKEEKREKRAKEREKEAKSLPRRIAAAKRLLKKEGICPCANCSCELRHICLKPNCKCGLEHLEGI